MEEFELLITYKGEERMFPASLQVTGYTHRFVVDIEGQSIIFEPDEERNYRAVLSYEDLNNNKNIDRELLKIISEKIKEIIS
jgi:hypothetical protein